MAVVQAGLWAVVVTLLAFSLVERALRLLDTVSSASPKSPVGDQTAHIYRMLAVQLSLWATVLCIAAAVTVIRWWLARNRSRVMLPRLIVSPAITSVILAALGTSVTYFVLSLSGLIWSVPPTRRFWLVISAISALVIAAGLGFLAGGIRNVLHIGMDIINHFHRRVLPWAWASEPIPHDGAAYGRRRAIEDRFRAVLERVVQTERPTHLTVVGHSQGTVVAVDVLAGSHSSLEGIEVSLLTMGSPLTHLYERYFPNLYGTGTPTPRVVRWINVYREDDYIGAVVRPNSSPMPENQSVPLAGLDGHAHYRRQTAVAKILAELAPVCTPIRADQ